MCISLYCPNRQGLTIAANREFVLQILWKVVSMYQFLTDGQRNELWRSTLCDRSRLPFRYALCVSGTETLTPGNFSTVNQCRTRTSGLPT